MSTKDQNATLDKKGTELNVKTEIEPDTLKSLFEKELNEMYDGEKQLLSALPEMAQAAYDEELEEAFYNHLEQTRKHVDRLDKIFSRLNINKREEKCLAMESLIKSGKKVISEMKDSPVRDSALIISAQKIEHLEIAAYGSLAELADVLDFYQIIDLLERTLEEEEETDALLSEIAEDINDTASEL